MKTLNTYISETLSHNKCVNEWKLTDDSKVERVYKYSPNDKFDLEEIIRKKISFETKSDYLDLTDIDVSKITDFETSGGLFSVMSTNIKTVNITGWNTRNCKNMRMMFRGCETLEKIIGIEHLDVSNVNNMSSMFDECHHLKELNISKWKIKETCAFRTTFYNCEELNIIGIKNIPANPTNTKEYSDTFYNCKNIDTPNWYIGR